MKKNILLILLIFVASFSSHKVVADEDVTEMEKMSEQLKQISRKLNRGQFEGDDLSAWTKLTIKMTSAASLCVANNEAALLDLKTQMEGLGEEVKGEDAEVTKKRGLYQKEKEELDKALAKCNLYIDSADEIKQLISEAEKFYFKQKYLVRSPDMLQLTIAYLKNPVALLEKSGEFVFLKSGIREFEIKHIVLNSSAVIFSVSSG